MEFARRWSPPMALVFLAAVWSGSCGPSTPERSAGTAAGSTRLELEAYGGFAYVHNPQNNRLEIAFLKDTDVPGCNVDQQGVDLMVTSGNIIEPSPAPDTKMWDVSASVLRFPDLEAGGGALVATRGPRPTGAPGNPANEADWHDLQWVAGIGQEYQNSTLNPDWLSKVDGRLVLTRGVIRAASPSDVVARDAVFEFRRPSGTGSYSQSITDTTNFEVQVPSNQVVINLSGPPGRIVVVPIAPGQPVTLRLMARHAPQTSSALPFNGPVEHFCAFYQLLQPVPDASQQLIPYFVGNPKVPAAASAGQPSPGPFCPANWF